MAQQKEKWIQGAVKRPGAFTKWCKQHRFNRVTESCIDLALRVSKKTGNTRLARQANLARTFRKLNRKRAGK